MSNERRKHTRIPAIIQVIWEGSSTHYEARTSDLTIRGCFIDTIGQATVGETIKFSLILTAGEIQLQGEVMYVLPNTGFGVRFLNVPEEMRKQLEWLVKAEEYESERS